MSASIITETRSLLFEYDSELEWTKFITVTVGRSKPEVGSQTIDIDYTITCDFLVHEDIFRQQSPFFEAALGRDFSEARNRAIKLSEHTPQAFELYLRWVYSHRIMVSGVVKNTEQEHSITTFSIMCRAYILGDILQDIDFEDALIDAIIQRVVSGNWWPTEETRYVYENTVEGAALRRVFTALAAEECMGSGVFGTSGIYGESVYGKDAQKYNTVESLCDLMKLMDKRIKPDVDDDQDAGIKWYEKTCRYHEHKEGSCYRTRIGISKAMSSPLSSVAASSSSTVDDGDSE